MRLRTPRRGVTARFELTPPRIPAWGGGCAQARRGRAASRIMPAMMRSRGVAGACAGATFPARLAGRLCVVTVVCVAASRAMLAQSPDASDWGYYGGDAFGQRFSSLGEINRTNVSRLSVAWTYRTAELGAGLTRAGKLTFEATPVLAFGLLYLETGTNIVIALDPESGRARWRFDPRIDRARRYAEVSSRGVSVWESSDARQPGPCRRRVFTRTLDARLLALDAETGRPCADFGDRGQGDLTRGVRIRDPGAYLVSSPPAVCGNAVIVGSAIGDNRATDVERGVIRAYDAQSGAQLWSFDPLPDSPSHPAASEWNLAQAAGTGAGNAWGVMSVDEEHGLVLVPTGSASPDFYGGMRLGANRFADSLLALDARSRRLVWQQQLIHHDLWDYQVAAPPVLGDIEVQGGRVPAGPPAAHNPAPGHRRPPSLEPFVCRWCWPTRVPERRQLVRYAGPPCGRPAAPYGRAPPLPSAASRRSRRATSPARPRPGLPWCP